MSQRKEKIKTWLKIGAGGVALAIGLLLAWTATFKLPELEGFESRLITQSTKIFDRTGEHLLYEFHDEIRRTVVPLDDISDSVKEATIAIEDEDFYNHAGIKPGAILRATLVNLREGSFSQGGSTITQQVVKNALLTTEKTITRKLKEWVLALKLERMLTKDQILEQYLNTSPYGGNVYGVEEAANRFFDKSASELTIAESAYIAAIPQAPTYYSPYGANVDALEARKNLVLEKMYNLSFIDKGEYEEALQENVEFVERSDTGIDAPHFVFFVGKYIEEKYGPRALYEQGLRVTTTLDYDLQIKAEEIVKRYALANSTRFDAENAALVAIDPLTGQILTMVGSRDYFDEEIPGKFNIATAHRQPGSAFKPFVYATAFKKGYTPETVVFDLKTQFSTACSPDNLTSGGPCYSPTNYDNRFRGPMTFRSALAQSINVPAVKALYLAGLQDSLRTARDMGIESLEDVERYGLTLVLGGGEVSLLDITSAYSVFANDGVRNKYASILRIEDANGNVLEEFEADPERVLDEQVSRQITDILADNEARAPSFGSNSYLYFPGQDVAAKTGTTNDYKDAWIVGYSPTITVGAWAGNNDNSSMNKEVAGFIVAPLWNEFMQEALRVVPSARFRRPRPIDSDLKPVLRGDIGAMGAPHNILHWVDKSNPRGPIPANPARDAQYTLWEYPVQLWSRGGGTIDQQPDSSDDSEDNEEENIGSSEVYRLSGLDNEYRPTDTISFTVRPSNTLVAFDVFIDGQLLGSVHNNPFRFSFKPSDFNMSAGDYTLSVNVTNRDGSITVEEERIEIIN